MDWPSPGHLSSCKSVCSYTDVVFFKVFRRYNILRRQEENKLPSTPLLFGVHSMRFLVCDDNKMFAENISKLLNDLCSERSIDVTIDSFTDAGML